LWFIGVILEKNVFSGPTIITQQAEACSVYRLSAYNIFFILLSILNLVFFFSVTDKGHNSVIHTVLAVGLVRFRWFPKKLFNILPELDF